MQINQVTKLEEKPKLFLRLDIQYFSDGEEIVADGGEESYGSIEYTTPEEPVVRGFYNPESEIQYPSIENPLWSDSEPEELEEVYEEEEPEEIFEEQPPQPDPRDAYIQQLAQQNRQMQQILMFQQRNPQAFQQQMGVQQQQFPQQFQQQQAPQEPQLSPEELNEKMMEEFYENPSEFFKKIQEQAIAEARKDIDPYIKERKVESEVSQITQKYGQDFIDHIPSVQNLVIELGEQEVERLGLERVYLMARGMNSFNQPQYQQPQEPQLSPEQILGNPQFVSYLAENPAIQQAVMQQYMADKQQSQPPRVMSNQAGASPSFTPETRPKSISEATRLAQQYFGG